MVFYNWTDCEHYKDIKKCKLGKPDGMWMPHVFCPRTEDCCCAYCEYKKRCPQICKTVEKHSSY